MFNANLKCANTKKGDFFVSGLKCNLYAKGSKRFTKDAKFICSQLRGGFTYLTAF